MPLNLVGDYAGGSLYWRVGLLAGHPRSAARRARDRWSMRPSSTAPRIAGDHVLRHARRRHLAPQRGTNMTDSGSHFYDCLRVRRRPLDRGRADRGEVLRAAAAAARHRRRRASGRSCRRDHWKAAKARARPRRFKTRSARRMGHAARSTAMPASSPVLRLVTRRPQHPHMKARGTFVEIDGIVQPAPAPRFSRTVPHNADAAAGHHAAKTPTAALSRTGSRRATRSTALRRAGLID